MFNFSQSTYPPGAQTFNHNLMEQYKIACTAADNVSARRETSNRYLITLNVAIVVMYGLQHSGPVNWTLLLPLAASGAMTSLISLAIIESHRRLNQAKFPIITAMEKHLPVATYQREWKLLKEKSWWNRYLEVSRLDSIIYSLFLVIHVIVPITIAISQR